MEFLTSIVCVDMEKGISSYESGLIFMNFTGYEEVLSGSDSNNTFIVYSARRPDT